MFLEFLIGEFDAVGPVRRGHAAILMLTERNVPSVDEGAALVPASYLMPGQESPFM